MKQSLIEKFVEVPKNSMFNFKEAQFVLLPRRSYMLKGKNLVMQAQESIDTLLSWRRFLQAMLDF